MLRGSKALVTGGSRGIGREIARRLVEAGAKVIITGRNEETLQVSAGQIGADYLCWDIADISVMQKNFDLAVKKCGGLDIVVSNAGVLTKSNEWGLGMLELSEQQWDEVMNTNLKASYFLMQTAVRYYYRNQIKGNLMNIASVSATEPYYGPYSTSKGGVVGLTRGWGKMFAPYGIVINGIGPGPIATEMNHWHEGDTLQNNRIPTGRFGTVEEIAGLAMYLLSEEANQIIGQTIIMDGAYDIK